MVQRDQCGGTLFLGARDIFPKGKVQNLNRAPVRRRQGVHRVDIAMVQGQKFGLALVISPGGQCCRKTIRAGVAMVDDKGLGVAVIGFDPQTQGQYGFHGLNIIDR